VTSLFVKTNNTNGTNHLLNELTYKALPFIWKREVWGRIKILRDYNDYVNRK
jgi:hypothetical protein